VNGLSLWWRSARIIAVFAIVTIIGLEIYGWMMLGLCALVGPIPVLVIASLPGFAVTVADVRRLTGRRPAQPRGEPVTVTPERLTGTMAW